jgi:hypothetical protein
MISSWDYSRRSKDDSHRTVRRSPATGDSPMSELPLEWKINHLMNDKPLQAALAEIEAYREELAGDQPQEEVEA